MTRNGSKGRPGIHRLLALVALVLVGTAAVASRTNATPNNANTFSFDAVCDGQPLTITVLTAAHPPTSNGSAGHVVGATAVGVVMGISVLNLLTGESAVLFEKPVAQHHPLVTCTYTFAPALPEFLVFSAEVLMTPRG